MRSLALVPERVLNVTRGIPIRRTFRAGTARLREPEKARSREGRRPGAGGCSAGAAAGSPRQAPSGMVIVIVARLLAAVVPVRCAQAAGDHIQLGRPGGKSASDISARSAEENCSP